jgi:hypothetical protein
LVDFTQTFSLLGSAGGARITAPLTGSVTKGTWVLAQRINVAAMPQGYMQYNYLLPAQYNPAFLYPILFYGHENDEGMNGGTYPSNPGDFLIPQTIVDGAFNTIAFRTNFPCIVVVPQCDQSQDTSGSSPNSNFGGYNDSANSGGNEQAINALLAYMKTQFSVDATRCYCTGDSLGAIGSLAWLVDNNRATNQGLNLWTAAMCFSEQLYRPATPNSQVFNRMRTVPLIVVPTPSDNVPSSYDQPAWQYYMGNNNYPTPATYNSGGVNAIRAGTNNFWMINTTSGVPWDTYRLLNADGGNGTNLYNLLFSFII